MKISDFIFLCVSVCLCVDQQYMCVCVCVFEQILSSATKQTNLNFRKWSYYHRSKNVSIYIPKIEKFSHSISHQTLFSYIVENIFISQKHKQCKYMMKKFSSKFKLHSFSEADRPSLLIS